MTQIVDRIQSGRVLSTQHAPAHGDHLAQERLSLFVLPLKSKQRTQVVDRTEGIQVLVAQDTPTDL